MQWRFFNRKRIQTRWVVGALASERLTSASNDTNLIIWNANLIILNPKFIIFVARRTALSSCWRFFHSLLYKMQSNTIGHTTDEGGGQVGAAPAFWNAEIKILRSKMRIRRLKNDDLGRPGGWCLRLITPLTKASTGASYALRLQVMVFWHSKTVDGFYTQQWWWHSKMMDLLPYIYTTVWYSRTGAAKDSTAGEWNWWFLQ